MTPKVSVVIPNWNGLELLEKSLPKILILEEVYEWILVDDGSTDGSIAWVKENFPKVSVVEKPRNEGFPKAVNAGARVARGEFLAIINPDLIPEKDAVAKALSDFSDSKVAGVTFSETGEKGWGVGIWNNGWLETPYSQGDMTKPHETFWGSGGETVYRKSVWEKLHGYDEIFTPGYWEDIDFGYRLRKRGWKLFWEPKAIVRSAKRGETFAKRYKGDKLTKIKERNRLLFIWKNITSEKLLKEHLWAVVRRCLAHPGYLVVVALALGSMPQIRERRLIERKEAVLTDEEVFSQFPRT